MLSYSVSTGVKEAIWICTDEPAVSFQEVLMERPGGTAAAPSLLGMCSYNHLSTSPTTAFYDFHTQTLCMTLDNEEAVNNV